MLARFLALVLASLPLALGGCSTVDPKPARPTATVAVTIDSIPSEADVYAIERDGNLGRKLGTTPFVYEVGLAPQWRRDTTGLTADILEDVYMWHYGGVKWEFRRGSGQWRDGQALVLDVALAKDDHSIGVASKAIFDSRDGFTDKRVALTVPLKSIEQVNREIEMYLRQQALSSQQRIVIQQQKDELDSINGALDAMIKLRGLGVFD